MEIIDAKSMIHRTQNDDYFLLLKYSHTHPNLSYSPFLHFLFQNINQTPNHFIYTFPIDDRYGKQFDGLEIHLVLDF